MKNHSLYKKIPVAAAIVFLSYSVSLAADPKVTTTPLISESGLLMVMGIIALCLLAVIVFLITYPFYGMHKKTTNDNLKQLLTLVGLTAIFQLVTPNSVSAQSTAVDSVASVSQNLGMIIEKGVSAKWSAFEVGYWMLFVIILVESLVILAILGSFFYKIYLQSVEIENETRVKQGKKAIDFWDKFNATVAVEDEKDLQLDHNYDGIKELDNALPPWWKYGFYLTIVFSCIYLWRYHLSHQAPLQLQELAQETQRGEEEVAQYLAKTAMGVDENTVKLLTKTGDISAGKAIFQTNCAVCHGAGGEGGVGPNLTDANWLHKGGIKDIFRTVKYGVEGKGMKAWKDELSPMKIAQVSSFIKSLKGTTPPNPKEPQGDIYIEEEAAAAPADSISAPK